MAKRRADVISLRDLSKSVDKAVELATKRHGIKAEKSNLLINWEIIGRILRELEDFNTAFQFATEVTKRVEVQGIKAQPACCKLGPGEILVGFIERAQLPMQIGQ